MNFHELHARYFDFMREKGYVDRERETLLSPVYPTTFAMSGGPDLAFKFWRGDADMRGNYIVNQPCIRHWDIDQAGDNRHLSFFNMFVADSIEGFDRETVMRHTFEFLTGEMELDPNRFFVTYFGGGVVEGTEFPEDKHVKEIWKKFGLDDSRILPMTGNNVMEAFVANTVEPVGGPRTEMFYDLRANRTRVQSVEDFMKFSDEGNILELCTQVLYNCQISWKDRKSPKRTAQFKQMDREAIAMGFGPQRLLRILEGVSDIGQISELAALMECLGERWREDSGRRAFHRQSVVVADHIRGLTFLIHDGILDLHGKKNRSRRYLFRYYLKSFKRNLQQLPLTKPPEEVIRSAGKLAIGNFSRYFPSFDSQADFIVEKLVELYNGIENVDQPQMDTSGLGSQLADKAP